MNQPLTPEQGKRRKHRGADNFTRGYLIAAAETMREFNDRTIACHLMCCAGVTSRAELRAANLEPFDYRPLLKVCKLEGIR